MTSTTPPDRYAASLRWLHWSIFALVLLAYVFINLFELFPRGSATRGNVLAAHFLAGLAVLLLVLPRLAVRLGHVDPPVRPPLDRWMAVLSKVTHVALYLFLLVQPVLGLITLQVGGKAISLFGFTVLPPRFGAGDRALSHQWEDIHGTIGEVFYYVIGLHIAAALWHHFGRRDNTLRRML
ncbi:cytochrome b [Dyella sp.]|jgi:cytochrome b561|uniref:cytochrome b n=1 Tax=Dyella sp. TaxID=1869338 RepID=UPI002D765546|nr:cytochrome b [Dyella sp.]HET6433659.1 cytochrome b [Dyella sp.]